MVRETFRLKGINTKNVSNEEFNFDEDKEELNNKKPI